MQYRKFRHFNTRGFSLIEVIIYIALFSLLLGTAFVAAYQLIDSSDKLNVKNITQEEGNFVMRKIGWALTGIDSGSVPIIGGTAPCKQTLSVMKTDLTVNPVVIRSNTISGIPYIEIQKNGGTFYPITTANVTATCLSFSPITGTPAGVTATATIDGANFTVTKYIRK